MRMHRPEVAFKAMADRQARELVNQAQFDQAGLVEEDDEENWWDSPEAGEDGGVVDSAAIVRGFHWAMEFTDLIGACQGFVAGASRLVPKLRTRVLRVPARHRGTPTGEDPGNRGLDRDRSVHREDGSGRGPGRAAAGRACSERVR